MATVYLARMRRPMGFSRLVAIKAMHPQFAKDPSFVSMFMDEARLTARLRHPNVVPTMDIVAEDGHLLLVMEYVEGASLATLLRSVKNAGTKIPVPIACAIVHDMLLGLHEAHQTKDDEGLPLSIIHRDVSPHNVLVGVDGLSRVLDFGVAKARQNTHRSNDNEIKGKIPYMPPEQLFGEALDHRVDVYAAGVTLWEALCCERLFDGPSETALVRQISEEPIKKPSDRVEGLPPALDALVLKALAREANDRFESALAMAEAIASIVPLPTRTEVSSWARQYVTPREVPSGKIPTSEQQLADHMATALVGILERNSMRSPSQRRTAPGTLAMTPVPSLRPAGSARTTRVAIGVAAAALLVAGAAVAQVARTESAPPVREVHVVVPQPTQLAETAPVVPANAALATKEAKTKETKEETVAPAPVKAAVMAKAPRIVVAAKPAEAPSNNCKIPYTIDANGQKHYKVECM
ncbi:MAG: serine/threonine protein kinase [Labilithrix sp.]|nr:serine/threonine protein kinase [Labilithrix sp.]MCW5810789.1 serine/threonine protein kinase [Labilithrix sp.]